MMSTKSRVIASSLQLYSAAYTTKSNQRQWLVTLRRIIRWYTLSEPSLFGERTSTAFQMIRLCLFKHSGSNINQIF